MGNGLFANCMPESRGLNMEGDEHVQENEKEEKILEFAEERRAAVRAVVKASFMCRKVQAQLVGESTVEKKDRSPVTVADFAAQALVIEELSKAFPEYPFIAEEGIKILQDNSYVRQQVLENVQTVLPDIDEEGLLNTIDKGKTYAIPEETKLWWTLDPIDGTLGFLRREQYSVALALIQDGEPILGILGCPSLPHSLSSVLHQQQQQQQQKKNKEERKDKDQKNDDEEEKEEGANMGCILVAVKGQGAFIRSMENDKEYRISVSDIDDVSKASFTESVEASHSSHNHSAQIAKLLGVTAEPVRMDSQCKYGVVAMGAASIYLRISNGSYQEKIWDHAAGYVVVKEAGGEVCDLNGAPLDFSVGRTLKNNKGIVATNGKVHDEVLAAIKAVNPLGNSIKKD